MDIPVVSAGNGKFQQKAKPPNSYFYVCVNPKTPSLRTFSLYITFTFKSISIHPHLCINVFVISRRFWQYLFKATLENCIFAKFSGAYAYLVRQKTVSSEVSTDSDINYACGKFSHAVILNKNPVFSR